MIFITGGVASGKRSYAQSLGFTDEDMSVGVLDGSPVVVDAQELVRKAELDPALIEVLSACQVVICSEVGSGIVPLDADERAWRERAGRLAEQLAQRAESVVRMVCGIPLVLRP